MKTKFVSKEKIFIAAFYQIRFLKIGLMTRADNMRLFPCSFLFNSFHCKALIHYIITQTDMADVIQSDKDCNEELIKPILQSLICG